MKISRILTLALAAFMITAASPLIPPASAGKNPPGIVGSPYDDYKKKSSAPKKALKKTGSGIKRGMTKIKNGFAWTSRKIKDLFTSSDQQPGWSADSQ